MSFLARTTTLVTALMIASWPALAQIDGFSVDSGSSSNKTLSTDEYNDIPKGLLLTDKGSDKTNAEKEAVAGTAEAGAAAAGTEAEAPRMSYETALKLYRQSKFAEAIRGLAPLAEQGQSNAQELLGIMYRTGQGVEKNPAKAFDLMRKAAEDNRPLAQHHLGVMYFTGEGTAADPIIGLSWLHVAILHYPDGPEKTRAQQDRDNVYKSLNRRDKENALKIAHEFLDKKGEGHLLDMQ